MSLWTTRTLIERALQLTGGEAGDLYNVELWKIMLNQGQDNMLASSRAFQKTVEYTYTIQSNFSEPSDFLDFAKEPPLFRNISGETMTLKPVSRTQLYEYDSYYRDADNTNYPTHIRTDDFYVHPQPLSEGTLILPYTYRPYYLSEDNDIPFGGNSRYVRFAEGLSYFVANSVLMPINPALAGAMWNVYKERRGEMKEMARETAQTDNYVRTLANRR